MQQLEDNWLHREMYSHNFHFCCQSHRPRTQWTWNKLPFPYKVLHETQKETNWYSMYISSHDHMIDFFVTPLSFPLKRGIQYPLLQNLLYLIPISIRKL